MVKLAIVLLLAVTLVTIWVTSRKKAAPTNEPPLHPSTIVLSARNGSVSGWEKPSTVETAL